MACLAARGFAPRTEGHTGVAARWPKLLKESRDPPKVTRFRRAFAINFFRTLRPGALLVVLSSASLFAQQAPIDSMANDKIGTYDWVRPQADFIRREVMI